MADFNPDRALVIEIAAALSILQPDDDAMTLWINSMASDDYKFGSGLLRSVEDEYDPLGVLVMLNGGEWVWDENDEAWAYEGSAVDLSSSRLMVFLRVKHYDATMADHLLEALVRMADNNQGFAPIASTLRAAMEKKSADHTRLNDAARASVTVRSPLDRDHAFERTRKNYDLKPFYAR